MRQTISISRTSYDPNTMGGGCPMQAGRHLGGFVSYPERIDAVKERLRGAKFFDHFGQATMFWKSQSAPEKDHIVQALRFELGKVEIAAIRERMLGLLSHVDKELASRVAQGLGVMVPTKLDGPLNRSVPADANPKEFEPRAAQPPVEASAALSMANSVKDSATTRKVAILAADGVDGTAVAELKRLLIEAGAQPKVVAPRLGALKAENGGDVTADFSLLTVGSVLFDAVFIPGGSRSVEALKADVTAVHFVNEAYKHCKALAATDAGAELLPIAVRNKDGKVHDGKTAQRSRGRRDRRRARPAEYGRPGVHQSYCAAPPLERESKGQQVPAW